MEGTYVVKLLEGVRSKGLNINNLLEDSGISSSLLKSPNVRVSFKQLAHLSTNLIDHLNDECFGLLDKPQRRGTFKLMCQSSICADTIGEALKLCAEFQNLLENTWSHEIIEEGEYTTYRLAARKGVRLKHRIALEYHYSTLYRTLCWMSNSQLPLEQVQLTVKEPESTQRYRFMFYDAPIVFNHRDSGLVFSQKAMASENVRDKRELKTFLKQTPLTFLTQTVPAENISGRMRTYIERRLLRNNQLPSIEDAALHVNMKPQTFRRRLSEENTTFSELKAETRRDLAINLILDSDNNVSRVSELLDFSEPSAFIRAFKQWTGLTPNNYRKTTAL